MEILQAQKLLSYSKIVWMKVVFSKSKKDDVLNETKDALSGIDQLLDSHLRDMNKYSQVEEKDKTIVQIWTRLKSVLSF